jgi:hypothetical protein
LITLIRNFLPRSGSPLALAKSAQAVRENLSEAPTVLKRAAQAVLRQKVELGTASGLARFSSRSDMS